MKKYILPSLGGLAIIAAGVVLGPLPASAAGYPPSDPCSCSKSTVVVPDDPGAQAGLADTGSDISLAVVGGSAGAVVLGASIVVVARRRRSRSTH